jgi:hypothetical protein
MSWRKFTIEGSKSKTHCFSKNDEKYFSKRGPAVPHGQTPLNCGSIHAAHASQQSVHTMSVGMVLWPAGDVADEKQDLSDF